MNNLPEELLLTIFDFLPRHFLVNVIPSVCVRWRALARAPVLWRGIDLGRDFDDDESRMTTAFMLERGFDSVVNKFDLATKSPLSDDTLDYLDRVLRVCRNVSRASFCVRLSSSPPDQRRRLFEIILSSDVLNQLRSLSFNRGDWDNHEIFQTVARFSSQLRSLTLLCHIPVAMEKFPTMTSLQRLDLDLKGLQQNGVARAASALRQTLVYLHSLTLRSLSLFGAEDFRSLFHIPTTAGYCRNLSHLSLSTFSIEFRFLGRHLLKLLPGLTSLSLSDVDLIEVLEAGYNPFLYLAR